MTFKQFMYGALVVPSKVLSGITDLLLGSYQRDAQGKIKTAYRTGEPLTNRGLLGVLLDGVKYLGRTASNFLTNHQVAIGSAFWLSALLAGAAALTVYLWPAALAAVTTFEIAGYSIAALVGADVALQIGAIAALSAVATSFAVYVVAGFVNTINFFRECVANRKNNDADKAANKDFDEEDVGNSNSKMRDGLGGRPANDAANNAQDAEPVHNKGPLNQEPSQPKADDDLELDSEESSSHSARV